MGSGMHIQPSNKPLGGFTISFNHNKEVMLLERTVKLLKWATDTPGVRLQLLNYADVINICEGRAGACMSVLRAWNSLGGCASQAHDMGVVR